MNAFESENGSRNVLYIIGIGAGGGADMTLRARDIIARSDLIVGYTVYNDLLKKDFPDKEYFTTPMRKEKDRCAYALRAAGAGKKTVLICSGDSAVYGMASLAFELAEQMKSGAEIRVVPGVTSALSASALTGAPISGDFAAISLSNILTEQSVIEKRLEAASKGDFVIALYNPGSSRRKEQLRKACDIIARHRSLKTPCAVAENIGRQGEKTRFLTLKALTREQANMFMTIIIGNSKTRFITMADGQRRIVTPRGYRISDIGTQRESAGKPWLLIFGGTSEGRELAGYACSKGIPVKVCVATNYGRSVLPENPLMDIDSRGLTKAQILELLTNTKFGAVIDATHVYAPEITEKIADACEKTDQKYIRVTRDIYENNGSGTETDIRYVKNIEEAAKLLGTLSGRAFITTGSHEIDKYMAVSGAGDRFVFRVLPSGDSLKKCYSAGVKGKNIVCMQGPFSAQMNLCMLREYEADYLVTKISGGNGGYSQKLEAARTAGVKVIAVLPPEARSGITLREAYRVIDGIAGENGIASREAGLVIDGRDEERRKLSGGREGEF